MKNGADADGRAVAFSRSPYYDDVGLFQSSGPGRERIQPTGSNRGEEKMGRNSPLVVCSAILLCTASAFAADVKDNHGAGPADPVITANCELADHKMGVQTFSPPATVPDVDPAGVTFGPIVLSADEMFIGHVVLELDCSHTWIGDLIVRLLYDENSDDVIDATSTVICRSGRTVSCGPSGSGAGCGSNFTIGAVYRFDDTATSSLPSTGCFTGTDIPGGCYQPTGLGASPLSVFEGRTKGGRWWLLVSDNATSDLFTMTSWAVHILNTPVAVAPTSWGQLKVRYR